MKRPVLAFLIGTVSVSLSRDARAGEADQCAEILASGIRDNYSVLSEKDRYTLFRSRLCFQREQTYDSFRQRASSIKLNVPFAEKLIGLEGDSDAKRAVYKDKYEEFCSSTFDEFSNRE